MDVLFVKLKTRKLYKKIEVYEITGDLTGKARNNYKMLLVYKMWQF